MSVITSMYFYMVCGMPLWCMHFTDEMTHGWWPRRGRDERVTLRSDQVYRGQLGPHHASVTQQSGAAVPTKDNRPPWQLVSVTEGFHRQEYYACGSHEILCMTKFRNTVSCVLSPVSRMIWRRNARPSWRWSCMTAWMASVRQTMAEHKTKVLLVSTWKDMENVNVEVDVLLDTSGQTKLQGPFEICMCKSRQIINWTCLARVVTSTLLYGAQVWAQVAL